MSKRRATADSDDDDMGSDANPASKRARTEDSDDEADDAPPMPSTSKRKVKFKNDDSDDDGDGDDKETVKEDKIFEREHRDNIRAALESKRKVHGGIAEHGIIEAIEMHHFMCHKYLTFQFGSQINFIIGHNGSGKSAVLSAITVALGGKANSTGRGTGLKSFIREGESVAEVTISLKNQGDEAYKPKEFGKSIVITRRFTKDGSSSWKIKSKDGRVISTKRDELSAICDHMNIQVDNPMNVLTQDAARQFLGASAPAEKYKLFLRGTQLSQLSDEYDTCLENITQTTKVLAQKKEALPDLRTAFKEATVRFEEASKAREQKKKADELKKELAWAHVRGKEEELTLKMEEAAKMNRRLPKILDSIDLAQQEIDRASEQVTLSQAEYQALGDVDELNDQKNALQNEIRANKAKLTAFNNDLKQMDVSLKATNAQIDGYVTQINEEARRMQIHTQAKHDEMQHKLEKAREDVSHAESALSHIQKEKPQILHQIEEAKREGIAAEAEKTALQKQIQQAMDMIEKCTEAEKNSLAPYGNGIRGLLDKISKTQWMGDVPLGPLGLHVKAKDPKMWGQILRLQLGQFLTAFAITDARDRKELKRLLDSTGNGNTLVIIYEKDLFDYAQGEPPSNVLTVLRALEVSDPYVLRILINQAFIERQVLGTTRAEGERTLKDLGRGGSAWTADGFMVKVFPEGGAASTPIDMRRTNDATNLLLTGRDAASEIKHYREEIASVEGQYRALNIKVEEWKQRFRAGRQALDKISRDETQATDAVRRAKQILANLQQEANDDLPAGIAGFEAAKEEAEAEKASLLEQFADVVRQKAAVDEVQKDLVTRQVALRNQISEFKDRQDAASAKVQEAAAARVTAQASRKHYQDKFNEEKIKVDQIEEVVAVLQTEFENWTAKAEEYCERVEKPRKADEVQRNLESVQRALKEREKRHGATVEEMTIELNKAQAKLKTAEGDLKQMSNLNKALKASLIVRLAKWQEFRRHIALRCKLVFQFHLSHRGYYGKVLFNHDAGTLQLKVQTDDQTATQGARDKNPLSLSGGEKSFSTICLLLSLWESIGCPLRCLDEFDVFMDAVNRRISMKMMIDTANSSDKKQYILITPQDMGNVQIGSTVRVHRMTDPERGQGVLAFAA